MVMLNISLMHLNRKDESAFSSYCCIWGYYLIGLRLMLLPIRSSNKAALNKYFQLCWKFEQIVSHMQIPHPPHQKRIRYPKPKWLGSALAAPQNLKWQILGGTNVSTMVMMNNMKIVQCDISYTFKLAVEKGVKQWEVATITSISDVLQTR